jgi:hypothetical protein
MATPIPKRLRKAPARAARLSRNVTGSHESNGNESEDQAAERIDHELRHQIRVVSRRRALDVRDKIRLEILLRVMDLSNGYRTLSRFRCFGIHRP